MKPYIKKYEDCTFYYNPVLLHREDGPAIEYADGDKYYFINGKQYSEADYFVAIRRKNLILFI